MSIKLFKNKKIELNESTIMVNQPDIRKTVDYGRVSNLEELFLIRDIEEEYNSSLFFTLDFENKIFQFLSSPLRMIINLFSLLFISRIKIIFLVLFVFFSYEMFEIIDKLEFGKLSFIDYKNVLCVIGVFVLISIFKEKLPFFQEFKYIEVFKIIIISEKYGKVIIYEGHSTESYENIKNIFDLIINNVENFKEYEQKQEDGENIEYSIIEYEMSSQKIDDSIKDLEKYL